MKVARLNIPNQDFTDTQLMPTLFEMCVELLLFNKQAQAIERIFTRYKIEHKWVEEEVDEK